MPYIGNIPAESYAAFNVQYFTTSATDTYTLDRAVANELDIRLVINNVIQEPGAGKAYTAAGTTLTLSAATAGSDTMYAVYVGKAVQTVNPGAGSVGTTALQDNSVTNAKLADATQGDIIYYAAAGAPAQLSAGTSGHFLKTQGAGANPTWAAVSGTTINNNADNRVITGSGTANTLNGEANLTFNGSTFTATGTSSLDGAVVINESGASVDFRVESDAETHMLTVSGANNVVGISESGFFGDLGVGLHIKTNDSGGSVDGGANELVLENGSNTGMTILSGTSGEGSVNFGDSGDNNIGMLQYHHSNNSMQMYTNGSERIRIDSSGRVLVGDGSPIDTNANMSVYATANYPLATKVGATGNTQQIGFNNGNGHVGGITTNGTATAFNTSSDYRLKENISYDFDATARLKQLKPSRFNFKTDASKTVDGFLAHEVSSIVPEAITGSKDATETRQNIVLNANGTMIFNGVLEQDHIDGKADGSYPSDSTWIAEKEVPVYQSIDQAKLVPLLVKSLQELEARITTLENA